VIKPEEYKNYHNIYPPSEGAVAKLRGTPWPCSKEHPCEWGEGTCFVPGEMEHPDVLCAEPWVCANRVGGARSGPGESVPGVEFTGALKMHHIGANDICYDEEWETYGAPEMKMAVLRRKLKPCTAEDPCDIGEGDCDNNKALCKEGLACAFRDDSQGEHGEPVHGIDFTGDLLINANGDNDVCYNPHWPETDAHYEGKVVMSCDHGNNNCDGRAYFIIDGLRRWIPNDPTFLGVWPSHDEVIIKRPAAAFEDYPIGP